MGGVLRPPPRVDLGDKRTKPDIYTPQTRMVEGKWADKRGGQKADKREKRGGESGTKEGQNVIEMTKKRKRKFDLGDKRYILCFLCMWNIIQIVAEWLQKMCRKEKKYVRKKKGWTSDKDSSNGDIRFYETDHDRSTDRGRIRSIGGNGETLGKEVQKGT